MTYIMRFRLAKIHYLQEQLGLPANAVFVSAPDLAILDLKSDACGMIVGGLDHPIAATELIGRAHTLKKEPVKIEGIPIHWDFNNGNHYIDLFFLILPRWGVPRQFPISLISYRRT